MHGLNWPFKSHHCAACSLNLAISFGSILGLFMDCAPSDILASRVNICLSYITVIPGYIKKIQEFLFSYILTKGILYHEKIIAMTVLAFVASTCAFADATSVRMVLLCNHSKPLILLPTQRNKQVPPIQQIPMLNQAHSLRAQCQIRQTAQTTTTQPQIIGWLRRINAICVSKNPAIAGFFIVGFGEMRKVK